jgi:ankyrin repeat protein
MEQLVQLLVSHGADVHTPDEGGDTPLHLAARLCLGKAAAALLQAGAKLDVRNKGGSLPLELPATKRDGWNNPLPKEEEAFFEAVAQWAR